MGYKLSAILPLLVYLCSLLWSLHCKQSSVTMQFSPFGLRWMHPDAMSHCLELLTIELTMLLLGWCLYTIQVHRYLARNTFFLISVHYHSGFEMWFKSRPLVLIRAKYCIKYFGNRHFHRLKSNWADNWLLSSFMARCGLSTYYFMTYEGGKRLGVDFRHEICIWLLIMGSGPKRYWC